MTAIDYSPLNCWLETRERQEMSHSFTQVRLPDIPSYLKFGLLCRSFEDPLHAWETDTEDIDIPSDCYKATDTLNCTEKLLLLLKSLRFWIVSDVPTGLLEFALQLQNKDSFLKISAEFEEELVYIKSLRKIVSTQDDQRMIVAAAEGQPSVMMFLNRSCPQMIKNEQLIVHAVQSDHFECLVVAHENGCPWSSATTTAAAKFGRLECLKYAIEHGCPYDAQTLCQQAYQAGHVSCLRYAHERGCELNLNTPCVAVGIGGVECLRYAHDQHVTISPFASVGAAMVGNLEVLKLLRKTGYTWSRLTCQIAAKYGQLECLKYAHENGSPLTQATCEVAAEHGHLRCLQYAHEHGCTLTDQSAALAAKGGHGECLQYVLSHCSAGRSSAQVTLHCAEQGNLPLLRIARAHGCVWDAQTCAAAAGNGHLALLTYLHENHCPWDEDTCTAAARNGHLSCLQYAHQHGCAWSEDTAVLVRVLAVDSLATSKQCAEYFDFVTL